MVDIPDYCRSLDSAFLSENAFENALGGDWLSLVFLGLMGMVLFLAFLYMSSQMFRLPKVEAWARFELFQVFLTAVIAVSIAFALYGMCHWDSTFMYGPNGGASADLIAESKELCGMGGVEEFTPYCAAQGFLQKVKVRGDDVMQILIGINYIMSYLFKMTWNSSPMGIGFAVEPLAGFNQIMNVFMVAISGFIVSYLSVLVQMRVLDYFLISVPYYFLPLGLLLRSFAPTREFGGAVIGFGIASLFFYPMLLVLNDAILFAPFDAFIDSSAVAANMYGGGDYSELDAYLKANTELGIDKIAAEPIRSAEEINENFGIYNGVDGYGMPEDRKDIRTEDTGRKVGGFFADAELDSDTFQNIVAGKTWDLGNMIFWPYQLIFIYAMASVLLPLINFVIYVEIARELTQILGVQMDLTNITRLI